ncbi:MAG: acyltransferase [Candidatus Omnitrophota bacterium]
MINLILNFLLFLRYWFWKIIVQILGGRLGRGTKIYERVKIFSTKQSPVFIGENCILQTGAILASSDNGKITLDKHVYIGEYTILSSKNEIHVGKNSIIAAQCFIVDFNHRFDNPDLLFYDSGFDCAKVTIGSNVWIGAGSRILKGVTIGEGSAIGAGSVVTRDIPPYSIVVGVPARVIKKRDKINK